MRRSAPGALERWRERLTPVAVDGLRTFVLDEGDGDPLVFLHGIPTQAYLWRDVVPIVARAHRAIAPDLLGFGFADRPETADLSPAGQAAYLSRVLDKLGVDRFALVVHDYGALVGAELLATSPERVTRLVVLNTSFWEEDWRGAARARNPLTLLTRPGVGEAAFRLARPALLKRAFALYVTERQRLTDETLAVYWHPFTDGFSDVLLRLFREGPTTMDADAFCRWRDALAAFDRPALVVWGQQDRTFQTPIGRRIAGILPDSSIEVFQHSNHFVPEDRPAALARLIAAFVSGRYIG